MVLTSMYVNFLRFGIFNNVPSFLFKELLGKLALRVNAIICVCDLTFINLI